MSVGNYKECFDCGAPEDLHKVCSIEGYDYFCSNCLEDRYIKNEESNFKAYWEGE